MKKLEKKNKASYIRNTNGKVISVFLSANTGLYGAIVSKTFDSFLTHIKNTKTDIAVVGKVGKRLFDALDLQDRTIRHFSLADSGLDRENMKTLLAFLVNYETIVVFHGKFKDILSQEPTAVSISGDVLQVDEESNIGEVRYIFEPTLESVMSYFETEILSSIFEQSVYESNLSKYASRMISLDRAIERIHSRAYTTKMITQKAKHRVRNNKQLNTISGIYRRIQNG